MVECVAHLISHKKHTCKQNKNSKPQCYIHKSVWSSRCSYVQEDVKTILFLLYVVNRHTWVQAIQTSFLSNIRCSNHRKNCTCKSMRNYHSGGCETKRTQNIQPISKPCLCERACVLHYELYSLYRVNHHSMTCTNPAHCPHTTHKKPITNASQNTCARTQALTCIGNGVTLWCKNAGGDLAVCLCSVIKTLFPDKPFTSALFTLFRELVWKKGESWMF